MNIRGLAAWSCLTAAMAFGVAACGGDDDDGGGGGGASSEGGGSLNVYSSLPLQGAVASAVGGRRSTGIKLALKQKGGKCGDFTIKYKSLDDSTAAAGTVGRRADLGQRAQGGAGRQRDRLHRRVQLGRVGDLDPDHQRGRASCRSARPTPQYGLTKKGTGATPGEPDKYYPTGERNYGRVVPIDTIQGAAQAQYMKDEGVTSVYMLDDTEVYGKGVVGEHQGVASRSSASRSRARIPGTARRRTTGRWRRRSRPAARTPCSRAGSSRTTARSCTRT